MINQAFRTPGATLADGHVKRLLQLSSTRSYQVCKPFALAPLT